MDITIKKEMFKIAKLNLHNGNTFHDIYIVDLEENEAEIIEKWDSIVQAMNDDLWEEIHLLAISKGFGKLDFLKAYLEESEEDLIIGWKESKPSDIIE